MSEINAVNTFSAKPSPEALLRQRVGEFVGVTFFGRMLAQARQSFVREGSYFSSGPGQEALEARLHEEFARQIGRSTTGGLHEAIVQRLLGRMGGQSDGG